MSKILVTGAGGYIGSVATHLLLERGHEIVAIDNLSNGYKEPLQQLQDTYGQDKIRFYIENIEDDVEAIMKNEGNIDGVIHYAAPCSVNESMENPGKYFNSVHIATSLLQAMVNSEIKNIIFSSTCAVYGEAEYVPVDEKHVTKPSNPYGESKRMVEKVIEWYASIHSIKYVILRYFNVCGASDDGQIGDSKKPSVHLMQNAVRGALGLDEFYLTCPQVDTPDKTPIRDYTNVVDLNDAHIKALEYLLNNGDNQIINLGTGNGNSVLEIVKTVQSLTGKYFEVTSSQPREGEYAKMVASIDKAKQVLGWEPTHTLEDSVNSLVTWYKGHPDGWV